MFFKSKEDFSLEVERFLREGSRYNNAIMSVNKVVRNKQDSEDYIGETILLLLSMARRGKFNNKSIDGIDAYIISSAQRMYFKKNKNLKKRSIWFFPIEEMINKLNNVHQNDLDKILFQKFEEHFFENLHLYIPKEINRTIFIAFLDRKKSKEIIKTIQEKNGDSLSENAVKTRKHRVKEKLIANMESYYHTFKKDKKFCK